MILIMKKLIIKNANVIDGTGRDLIKGASILIEEGMIKKIAAEDIEDKEAGEVIDAAGKYVLPGLIDCHVHYGGTESPYDYDWVMESDIQQAIVSTAQCKKSLDCGFTTVRDISANSIHLRNMINQGRIVGPRIVACGRGLSRTGGHGDSYRVPIEIVKRSHPWAVICDGKEEGKGAEEK